MTYAIDPAKWDSQFFGFPVGTLELPYEYDETALENILQDARTKFRLVYINVHGQAPDSITLLNKEYPCYARKLFLKKEVPKAMEQADARVKPYTTTFCPPSLERLAIQSGTMSHFRKDPGLAPHFEQLYLTWINFAISKELADSVWTWVEHGKHLGLATIRSAKRFDPATGQTQKEGRIGMLAVEPEYRKRGIGVQLIQACNYWCSSLDIPVNAVMVQKENAAAVALFEKQGFQLAREESSFHHWSSGWAYNAHRGWLVTRE